MKETPIYLLELVGYEGDPNLSSGAGRIRGDE
jgi:hypothetical protein